MNATDTTDTTGTPRTGDPANFLRQSLRANALFSSLSGLAFAGASGPIAAILGDVPPMMVFGVGLQLLAFAAALVWLSTRSEISVPLAITVIVADLGWVIGTAVVVHADLFARQGEIMALVLADVVLVLAVLQSIGVRRMTAVRAASAS